MRKASEKAYIFLYFWILLSLVMFICSLVYETQIFLESIKISISDQQENFEKVLLSLNEKQELLESEKITLAKQREEFELEKITLTKQREKLEAARKVSFYYSVIFQVGIAFTTVCMLVITRSGSN